MKKLFTFFCLLILTEPILAQAPQGLNYQAVARNSSGAELVNQAIGVQVIIHQNAANGIPVFSEIHVVTTNPFGLFTLVIGSTDTTNFSAINWGGNVYFLEILNGKNTIIYGFAKSILLTIL